MKKRILTDVGEVALMGLVLVAIVVLIFSLEAFMPGLGGMP